jgi:DNA-binding transcriptional LysR family regulator
MELRDLRYFAAIAEFKHMHKAADSLGLSQPALTKCVRRLELGLQTKLIKRTPKGIELTSVGAAFLSRVRHLRLTLDDISREAADLTHGRSGHLRIGVAPAAQDLLVSCCAGFLKAAPNATLAVTSGSNDALIPGLREGKFDLVVSGIPEQATPDLVHELLFEDQFVVIAAKNNAITRHRKVAIADLINYGWVLATPMSWSRKWVERAFHDHGLAPPQITLETGSIDLTMSTVSSTGLLGFHANWIVALSRRKFPVATVPVKELQWRRRMGVSYRKTSYLPPAALRFIEILKSAGSRRASSLDQ